MPLIAPLVLSAQLLLVADRPPQLDVRPSCQAATQSGVNGRTVETCMSEENAAQSTLSNNWRTYDAAQQARCTNLVRTGGPPSYVELLTCLDMEEQARKIPDRGMLNTPATNGMGTVN